MRSPARLLPLRNPVQHYDWGSTTAIPQLLGVAPDGRPQAELWLGAHPSAPSLADVGGSSPSVRWRPLDRLVADEPRGLLGEEVVARFGPRLPFLLKVLAAARPLSLQTHPTLEQARAGYAREEAAGVPRAAPQRSYKDRNHKPELLVALTPFDVLAGFRAPEASVDLFDGLVAAGAGRLRPWVQRLARHGLADTFWALWDLDAAGREALVADTAPAAARVAAGRGPWWREAAWAARLAEEHPTDAGVVVALLLNLLRLEPGQAMFVPAGRLHAYLHGVGIEVMASSDNVIRGGLTAKHVDLAELAAVLDVRAEQIEPLAGTGCPGGLDYPTPAPDFAVTRLAPATGGRVDATPQGPEILLCLDGRGCVDGIPLERGTALFVPASSGPYALEGPATVWRATVGGGRPDA